MANRLSPDKAFGKQIVRFAGDELGNAVQVLTKRPDGLHKAIHEARRAFKRVRGLCRLVQAADEAFFVQMRREIGALGQSLSILRDASALIESCSRQQAFAFRDDVAAAFQRLMDILLAHHKTLMSDTGLLEQTVDAAIAKCKAIQSEFDDLKLDLDAVKAAKVLRKGWKRTLRKGQAAIVQCENSPVTEAFHDLRKAAQAHVQQTNLLLDLWPSLLVQRQKDAKAISDILGEDHDLCILLEKIASDEALKPDRFVLETSIAERQSHLRSQALEKSKLLFSPDADFEARRIEMLWRHDAKADHDLD